MLAVANTKYTLTHLDAETNVAMVMANIHFFYYFTFPVTTLADIGCLFWFGERIFIGDNGVRGKNDRLAAC